MPQKEKDSFRVLEITQLCFFDFYLFDFHNKCVHSMYILMISRSFLHVQ